MTEATITTYADDDLVYVDPERRKVVGIVEFNRNGNAKPMEMEVSPKIRETDGDAKGSVRRFSKPRKRYYPWGTYRSMKKIYRLEGRVPEAERNISLDDAIARSLSEPFWD